MYPPIPHLSREAVKDYKVPGTDLVLKKGQSVVIPSVALHYDAEYFPDPEKFDPDRFNEQNKGLIQPFTYMPFGEGPRNCIGEYVTGVLMSHQRQKCNLFATGFRYYSNE